MFSKYRPMVFSAIFVPRQGTYHVYSLPYSLSLPCPQKVFLSPTSSILTCSVSETKEGEGKVERFVLKTGKAFFICNEVVNMHHCVSHENLSTENGKGPTDSLTM
jgi:hypothetical protein